MDRAKNNYRWLDKEGNELELTVFPEDPKEIIIRITDGSCASHCVDIWFEEKEELNSLIATLTKISKELYG
jgi:hypothetical protein